MKALRILFLAFPFLMWSPSIAQTFSINLTDKHLSKLGKAKSGHKRMMKYYKFYKKDSTKSIKERNKLAKKEWDSLAKAELMKVRIAKALLGKGDKSLQYVDSLQKVYSTSQKGIGNPSASETEKQEANAKLKALAKDKVTLEMAKYGNLYLAEYREADSLKNELTKWWAAMKDTASSDSLKQLAKEQVKTYALAQANRNPQFRGIMEHYNINGQSPDWKTLGKHVPGFDTLQSVFDSSPEELFAKAETMATHALSNAAGLQDFNKKSAELEAYKSQLNQLKDPKSMIEDGKEKGKQEAIDHFANNTQQLQAAQQRMTALLSKYSSFTNAGDLSTAVKRTSLQGKTFKERLVIGGNFNIVSIKPVSLDLSPLIGYRLNTKFYFGIGGNYRHTFGDSLRYQFYVTPSNSSVRVFANWDAFRNFFAYTEFERSGLKPKSGENSSTTWNNTYFVGVGKKLLIHPKVFMVITALYTINKESQTYPGRFQMRVGFQTSDLAFRKKKIYYSR